MMIDISKDIPKQSVVEHINRVHTTTSAENSNTVACHCVIEEHEPKYKFCDEFAEEGHSLRWCPRFKIQIFSPVKYREKTFEILFNTDDDYENNSGEFDNLEGFECSIQVPKDFLDGNYEMIQGHSVQKFEVMKIRNNVIMKMIKEQRRKRIEDSN